jgi:hypothetical protein
VSDFKPIPIHARSLKAMAAFASEDDMRYVLQSVLVEVSGHRVYYIATDGRIMCVLLGGDDDGPNRRAVVPARIIERTDPSLDAKGEVTPTALVVDGLIAGDMDTFRFDPVESDGNRYPNWRQVWPKEPPPPPTAAPVIGPMYLSALLEFEVAIWGPRFADGDSRDLSLWSAVFHGDGVAEIERAGHMEFRALISCKHRPAPGYFARPDWLTSLLTQELGVTP